MDFDKGATVTLKFNRTMIFDNMEESVSSNEERKS